MGFAKWMAALAGAATYCAAMAQTDPTIFVEQEQLVRAGEKVSAYGPDLFGDRVNLYTGALSFSQTDVSLPGNFALPVAVTRKFDSGKGGPSNGYFGDWDLDIPSISGTFATGTYNNGWAVADATPASLFKRCTYYGEPPQARPSKGLSVWQGYEYWYGNTLNAPGGGEIVYRSAANTQLPSDGNSWPLVTKGGWQIRCLPSLHANNLNKSKYHKGEGFLAIAPDGTQYRFDWLVERAGVSLKKWRGGSLDVLPRSEILIFPTLITDRHGNTVSLNFSTSNPNQLLSITASDGRSISFTYDANNFITSASDGSRTWTYSGTTVTLPDGSTWQNNVSALRFPVGYDANPSCMSPGTVAPQEYSGTIVHPSGAVGTFTTRGTNHGRKVSSTCTATGGWLFFPQNFGVRSIKSKTVSGPGMATATWSYAYSGTPGSDSTCPGCPDTKWVDVTDPAGVVTRHVYGIRSLVNEGHLLRTDEGWNGSSGWRTTTYTYRDKAAGPYPSPVGYSPNPRSDALSSLYHTPQSQRTISVQGTSFTWSATAFDIFARPTSIGRASSLGYSRGETVEYFDHLGKWVLGQTSRVIVPGYTYPAEQHTYNPTTANREASYSFGRLLHTSGYNADGTLAWRADPAGRATSYDSYHRGLARLITYPDSATESAAVDNRGLVTAHTNAFGTTTNYGYDTIGRLTSITYPADSPGWHPTTLAFERVAGAEYGIAGGHWRQTVATGNARTIRYFDALWRERLSRTYDAANEAGTRSVTERRYDADGRLTFESYPQRDIASVDGSVAGISNVYDGLGRISQSIQSSELGNLVTTSEYLAGFQKRITNPRGHATTQGFQVFDNPAEANLAWVSAPEGVSVTFTRDAFGKASAITRSGGGVSATRSYVYDVHQRLCKTIEPESGATVQDYDSAGNLAWRASGNALPSTSACDQGSVSAARKISYGYDNRNRLTSTTYGDGNPGITRTWTPDSLEATVVSGVSAWSYGYNNRRLMTSAMLVHNGVSYGLGYGYESHGHPSSLTYPDGVQIASAPNALGQPTQAGGYLTSATYQPNGALASFNRGNGVNFWMTQNARGLPEVWFDGAAGAPQGSRVTRDRYTYDANANVTAIADEEDGVYSRTMGYDALDRLTSANAPYLWGAASYTYDALDNLRTSVVGSRSLTHNYDANTNRLASLTGTTSIGFAYDANGNVSQRGSAQYAFDIGNRLALVQNTALYNYDGHGRRTQVRAAFDGWAFRVQVYGPNGQLLYGSHSSQGATKYVYLGKQLVAEVSAAGPVYQYTDALGSIVARSSGTRTRYEPYGATAGGATPTLGFTGHVNDTETGLVYMQQRYYEPMAGRFLSVDPVTTDAATGRSFGRFHYGNNNPYRFVDPDGRNPNDAPPRDPQVVPRLADPKILAAATYKLLDALSQPLQQGLTWALGDPPKTSADSVSATSAISAVRKSQPGEAYLRYESSNLEFSRVTPAGGLTPGTFAAPASDGVTAVESVNARYALPSPEIPRTNYVEIRPPAGTPIIGPRRVEGGTGREVIFPLGAPPGSVGPRLPTPTLAP